MRDAGPLDRELQRALLLEMQAVYPLGLDSFDAADIAARPTFANLAYLKELGLCTFVLKGYLSNRDILYRATITARGLDFLADDGGLSVILGVVTVKLHADTIRDLVATKIEASGLPEEKKSKLRAALAKLPAVALQEGSKRLMGLGIDHVGDIEAWLHHLPDWLGG